MTAQALAIAPAEGELVAVEILDSDRDALHILPIAILPVRHPALRRARMIKNARLDTAVELFHDAGSGSGQISVAGLAKRLGMATDPEDPEITLLNKVTQLTSFDVYSLRILLRETGIDIPDLSLLKLSHGKIQDLSIYMAKFTRPLLVEILGENATIQPYSSIISLFRDNGTDTVRRRLVDMAGRLGVKKDDIAKFLEDYADIFMSLSYYRECLDQLIPQVQSFLESVTDIRSNYQLSQDGGLMKVLDLTEHTINSLFANVTGRIESFERSTNDMWRNLSAERFRTIETAIKSYHTTLGGVLCALSVKMNAWVRLFPSPAFAGPLRRAEFIMSDLRQGIDRIQMIEKAAPMLANLNV